MLKPMLRWLGLALVVIVLDQISKSLVFGALAVGDSIPLVPYFNLVLTFNPGAAFSFLADAGGWQKWFFVTLALGVSGWIVVLLKQHAAEHLMSFALAMILGGALGNVIDRFVYGAVLDFVDFYVGSWHWPAFNVADSAITIGAVLLVVEQLRASKRKGVSE